MRAQGRQQSSYASEPLLGHNTYRRWELGTGICELDTYENWFPTPVSKEFQTLKRTPKDLRPCT
eukprot:4139428-Amphidinium_carterae.2